MKHIRSALAAGLLAIGSAAVASAQAPATVPQTHGPHGAHAKARGLERGLLKGISLSATEKANLKTVRAKYAPQMKALREQNKPEAEAMRAARQRGDTAAVRALREKDAPQRQAERAQAQKLFQAERADLRAALAPANQAKFDANAQQLQQRMAQRGEKGKNWKGGRRAPGA
jgi:hypothetical protein